MMEFESQIRQLLSDLRYRYRDSVENADAHDGYDCEGWYRGKAQAYEESIDRLETILGIGT